MLEHYLKKSLVRDSFQTNSNLKSSCFLFLLNNEIVRCFEIDSMQQEQKLFIRFGRYQYQSSFSERSNFNTQYAIEKILFKKIPDMHNYSTYKIPLLLYLLKL